MGSTLSVFTPTSTNLNQPPVKRGTYAFSYQNLTAKSTEVPQSARSMIAQHFHLVNTATLKKLISSGGLNRAKKQHSKAKILLEESTRNVENIPKTVILHPVYDKENKPEEVLPVLPAKVVKRTVLQASTSELLRCFGIFLHGRFQNLSGEFSPHDPMLWLRGLDRNLIAQGWQDIGFINPANIVFLYLLVRDLHMDTAKSLRQLQAQILTALYLSYSYMGHEISYPVKLFLHADESKDDFWKRCLRLIDTHSENMLRLNSDSGFFAKIFAELKSYGSVKPIQFVL